MAIPVREPRRLYLDPGTIISCPKCGAHIARLREVLRMGQKINAEAFEMLQHGHGPGVAMNCRECNTEFKDEKTGSLHTLEGWKPGLEEKGAFRG